MPTVTEILESKVTEQGPSVRVLEPRQLLSNQRLAEQGTPLFAHVLLDSDTPEKKRRSFATVLSFMFQCLVVGVLLIVPLMFTDVLPRQQLLTMLLAPPPPPPPPPAAAEAPKVMKQIQSNLNDGQLRTPTRVPQKVQMIREDDTPPAVSGLGGVVGGVPGGIPGGQLGGVIGGILSHTSSTAAVPKLVAPKRARISQGVTAGLLLRKIPPKYPPLAIQARIQGEVLLRAIISKEGVIEELEVVSGHPLLAPAALDAVRDWRYRPYLLNGVPIEVETTVLVTFQLGLY